MGGKGPLGSGDTSVLSHKRIAATSMVNPGFMPYENESVLRHRGDDLMIAMSPFWRLWLRFGQVLAITSISLTQASSWSVEVA